MLLFVSSSSNKNIFLQCLLRSHLSLVSSTLDILVTLTLELSLSSMMTVVFTQTFWTLKPSISIRKIFKINTFRSVICRVFLLWDILLLFHIIFSLHYLHSHCNKGFECPCIISNIPQQNPDTCLEISIIILQL